MVRRSGQLSVWTAPQDIHVGGRNYSKQCILGADLLHTSCIHDCTQCARSLPLFRKKPSNLHHNHMFEKHAEGGRHIVFHPYHSSFWCALVSFKITCCFPSEHVLRCTSCRCYSLFWMHTTHSWTCFVGDKVVCLEFNCNSVKCSDCQVFSYFQPSLSLPTSSQECSGSTVCVSLA